MASKRAGNRTTKASESKARRLKLMDEVAQSGEEIVITKHGHPVSRLVPCRQPSERLFGADRDIIGIRGDIVDPPAVEWEAQANPER